MFKLVSIWAGIMCGPMLLCAQTAVSDPVSQRCAQGEYYVRALGGYVLLPARYMPYAYELEPGITGSYISPSLPLARRCAHGNSASLGGNIQTGSINVLARSAGKLPAVKPDSKSRVDQFEVTIWSISLPKNQVREWTKVLITRNDQAMIIFDTDPGLWRSVLDSYFE
jgi:hypothetical protein